MATIVLKQVQWMLKIEEACSKNQFAGKTYPLYSQIEENKLRSEGSQFESTNTKIVLS